MTEDLTLLQLVMRVPMSCAFTAVRAVGIFMAITFCSLGRIVLPAVFTLEIGGNSHSRFRS
jgi:hypothetical protein